MDYRGRCEDVDGVGRHLIGESILTLDDHLYPHNDLKNYLI